LGKEKIVKLIQTFFDDKIRNAFYHSDYCLTDKVFRIAEGGVGEEISLSVISEKLARCFAFYSAFYRIHKEYRLSFKTIKKIHKWPNYEVFELIVDDDEGLVGFKIHFSNDNFTHFERRKDKVFGQNYSVEEEGISLHQGCIDDLKKEWRMNGRLYKE